MKRAIQKSIATVVLFLACCAFNARGCDANFHLLLVSEWGAPVENISIWDDNGDYLISGVTLDAAQVIPYDLMVTPGQVYHFYGHDTAYGQEFYVDFTPNDDEFLLDVIGYPFILYEWGDPISAPTTYTISTSSSPSGGGTTSGAGTKTCDATVNVTATPVAGYGFLNWTEGGTVVATTASYQFVVSANRTLVANFAPVVSVSATLADAWESTGDPGVFTITRSVNLGTALTVNLQISGTATPGIDYPEINPQVTIPAGATSAKVFVWPFQDNLVESTETVVLALQSSSSYAVGSPSSATNFIHDDTTLLADPKTNGPYSFVQSSYDAGTRNLSAWGNIGVNYSAIPITGIMDVPVALGTNSATGPFPLVIIVHGCGFDREGFLYLCDLLASQGIIAATIDFDSGSSGTLEAGIIVLEHIQQFKSWSQNPSNPLYGKVDLNHIMLMGHSCGGQKVDAARYYNAYTGSDPVPLDGSAGFGPYHFNLKGIVGLAPNDIDVAGATTENCLVICGTRDSFDMFRENYYDRDQPIDLGNPAQDANGFKASAQIFGADHPHFSSVLINDPDARISQAQQEDAVKLYVGAMARTVLLEQPQYSKFLQDYRFAASYLPAAVTNVSQFQAPHRLFIDHYEEDFDPATLSPPVSGANSWSVANSADLTEGAISPDGNETHGVRFHWSNVNNYYQTSFSGPGLNSTGYSNVVLRIGQSTEETPAVRRIRIVVQDKVGNSASYGVSLPYPDYLPGGSSVRTMKTVRIPLHGLATAGVNVTTLASIKIAPEAAPLGSTSGTVYFDDIQLSY